MSVTIQLRRDTAANWTSVNPTLADGEIGFETNTGLYKIGDGLTNWTTLGYGGIRGLDESTVLEFEGLTSTPTVPPSAHLNLYARDIAGRMFFRQQGSSGLTTPLQPSFFQNNIIIINTNATTSITSIGNSVTSVGTLSHPTPTLPYGWMTNFASAASGAATCGTGTNGTIFVRGTGPGDACGFFYYCRVAYPDSSYNTTGASTGSRTFLGLTNQTMAASVASDDPSGHYCGFFRCSATGGLNHTNWQFATKNNITLTLQDTGLEFLPEKVYDAYVFCAPGASEIGWRIDNVTDGTSFEGSQTLTLPDQSTYLRAGIQLQTINATARNIRMQRIYIESDR